MEENMDLKKKAFISYWANTIFLKLYNMFYVVDYLDTAKYDDKTKKLNTKFEEIDDKMKIQKIKEIIENNNKYKNYIEKRYKIFNKSEIEIKNYDNSSNLIDYLALTRHYFSHSNKYWLENEKSENMKKYKYDEDKFLLLVLLHLEPKQLHEFMSMMNKFCNKTIDNHNIYLRKKKTNFNKEIKKIIKEIKKDVEYQKIINPMYSFELPGKITSYFQTILDNKIPSEIQTYDLLITILKRVYPNDEKITDLLFEKNNGFHLKKYKGNLYLENIFGLDLVLSKNVIIQLIAYGILNNNNNTISLEEKLKDLVNDFEYSKREKKKKEREAILNNRVNYIEKKLSKIEELNFSELKKNAIKGLNRYVIANYEISENKQPQSHNNANVLNDLYEASKKETFISKINELFKKYDLEIPEKLFRLFKREQDYKTLLISINKFLWNDIIKNYHDEFIGKNKEEKKKYLYKILRITNTKNDNAKYKHKFIGIKPNRAFQILFKKEDMEGLNKIKKHKFKQLRSCIEKKDCDPTNLKIKLKKMCKNDFLLHWSYALNYSINRGKKNNLFYEINELGINNFDILLLMIYAVKYDRTVLEILVQKNVQINKNENLILQKILEYLYLNPGNRKKALINYIINSNQTYTKNDIKEFIEYISNDNIKYENVINKIHSNQKAREFIFTIEILLAIEADNKKDENLKKYRNAIFHTKRKEIVRFKEREMKEITKEINRLLEEVNYSGYEKPLIEFYSKNKKAKNLLKIKTESKALVKS